MDANNIKRVETAQDNMDRSILKITYKDRKTNKRIREQTKAPDILETVKRERERKKWS